MLAQPRVSSVPPKLSHSLHPPTSSFFNPLTAVKRLGSQARDRDTLAMVCSSPLPPCALILALRALIYNVSPCTSCDSRSRSSFLLWKAGDGSMCSLFTLCLGGMPRSSQASLHDWQIQFKSVT